MFNLKKKFKINLNRTYNLHNEFIMPIPKRRFAFVTGKCNSLGSAMPRRICGGERAVFCAAYFSDFKIWFSLSYAGFLKKDGLSVSSGVSTLFFCSGCCMAW